MSGIIGHTMYAMLAARAAQQRGLGIAPLAMQHWASYLAGSYLGCDIQTMPEAICIDTGREVGYGTAPLERSPITGGAVRPWFFKFQDQQYRPAEIHHLFYGRSHLTFGWAKEEQRHTLPWDHLADYCSAVVQDAIKLFGPAQRPLAYVLGWMTHLVGDGLIKSVAPGVTLHLLDGKYTPRNRPIQDLVTFHEVGRKELSLDWAALLDDLAQTPVEAVQLHYMRCAAKRGALGKETASAWAPERETLLRAVLAENRRYVRIYNQQVLDDMRLHEVGDRWECADSQRLASGGLSYDDMVKTAEKADFRHALWRIAESIANLFAEVTRVVPALANLPPDTGPTWNELTRRWKIAR